MAKRCYLLDGLCDFSGAGEWRWALFSGESDCRGAIRRRLDQPDTSPALVAPDDTLSIPLPALRSSPHIIVSHRALDTSLASRIAIYRNPAERPYTRRESELTALVLREVPWLHWREVRKNKPLSKLSPRQHLVFNLLLLGLSRKEIAAQVGISTGTVSGYIRDLYRHFRVKSHAELLQLHATRPATTKSASHSS